MLGPAQKAWFLERLRSVDGDLEGVGQLARHARLARGSAEPARGHDEALAGRAATRASAAAATGARPTPSARRSTTPCARPASPASSPSPATATASGPACRRRRCRPRPFEPVGVAFVTGSVSAPGLVEAYEHRFPKDHPLRALYVADVDGPAAARDQPAAAPRCAHAASSTSGPADLKRRSAASNPDLAPHLSFLDMGGHGYAALRVDGGRGRVRVRLHPAPARAQRDAGRRAAALPRLPPRGALAQGRDAAARARPRARATSASPADPCGIARVFCSACVLALEDGRPGVPSAAIPRRAIAAARRSEPRRRPPARRHGSSPLGSVPRRPHRSPARPRACCGPCT